MRSREGVVAPLRGCVGLWVCSCARDKRSAGVGHWLMLMMLWSDCVRVGTLGVVAGPGEKRCGPSLSARATPNHTQKKRLVGTLEM